MKPHFCILCGTTHTFEVGCDPVERAAVEARRDAAFAEILAASLVAREHWAERRRRRPWSSKDEMIMSGDWDHPQ